MLEISCLKFIDELSSKSPVPGGGGAAALVGSIGVALGSMVGNLTVGKEKYSDVEEDIQILLKKSEALIMRLNQLVHKDAAVFEPLANAYKMPITTAEERAEKERVLQECLVAAAKSAPGDRRVLPGGDPPPRPICEKGKPYGRQRRRSRSHYAEICDPGL